MGRTPHSSDNQVTNRAAGPAHPTARAPRASSSGSISLPEQNRARHLSMNSRRAEETLHAGNGSSARHRSARKYTAFTSTQSSYWDSLSKVWLTPGALQELDRHNRTQHSTNVTPPTPDKVFCTNLVQFARRGGPEFSHLRGYSKSQHGRQKMAPKKKRTQAAETAQTTTGAYSANYEQIMNDQNMLFFKRNEPEDRPRNYEEIKDRLGKERPHDSDHLAHVALDELGDTPTHNDLVNCMLPILHDTKLQGPQNRQFTIMKPGDIITAKVKRFAPDYYEGVKPNIVDKDLKRSLRTSIVPSNFSQDPIAPNFFLEFVLESKDATVARRQAGIDGVLGARCMNNLQNYPEMMPDKGPPPQEWEFDGNAYSFGLTYRPRDLTIYSVHMTPPKPRDKMPGYRIVQIEIYSMVSEESYHEAISAYRNIGDLAKEYRDRITTEASSRAAQLRAPSLSPPAEHPMSSELGIVSVSSREEEKEAESTEDDNESPMDSGTRSRNTEEPGNEQQDVLPRVGSNEEQGDENQDVLLRAGSGEEQDEHQDELLGGESQPAADDLAMSFHEPASHGDAPDWRLRLRSRVRQPEEDTTYSRPIKRRRQGPRGSKDVRIASDGED